jgi:hypothetical protein
LVSDWLAMVNLPAEAAEDKLMQEAIARSRPVGWRKARKKGAGRI